MDTIKPTYGDPIEHSKRVHRTALYLVGTACAVFLIVVMSSRSIQPSHPDLSLTLSVLAAVQAIIVIVIYQTLGRALESMSYKCAMQLVKTSQGFKDTMNSFNNTISVANSNANMEQARRDAQIRAVNALGGNRK